jgi:hypothetical protein
MYSVFTFGAMLFHWSLLVEFAVFNTELSAFVLVISQVMAEILRFMMALTFLLVSFSAAISVLVHENPHLNTFAKAALCLFSMTVRLYEHDYRNQIDDTILLTCVFSFVMMSVVLLLNLLIAQLNCEYENIAQDSVGYARLQRAGVIVDTLRSCPKATWAKFVESLNFDTAMDFNEGDVGMSGGLADRELASLHNVTRDSILRFGGLSSPDMQWPESQLTDQLGGKDEEPKLEKVEKQVGQLMQKLYKNKDRNRGGNRSYLGNSNANQNSGELSDGSDTEPQLARQASSSSSRTAV